METRGCLIGMLIIGVVWVLAEAPFLAQHLLTLISQNEAWPHLVTPQNWKGAYFHSLLPASSFSFFISHSFQLFLLPLLPPHPASAPPHSEKTTTTSLFHRQLRGELANWYRDVWLEKRPLDFTIKIGFTLNRILSPVNQGRKLFLKALLFFPTDN